MGVAVFLVLALMTAGVIVYPLLPGRLDTQRKPRPSAREVEEEIERAVRDFRRARSRDAQLCPTCGTAYRAGDRFCVRCGSSLEGNQDALHAPVCPSCEAPVRPGDQFCARCGYRMVNLGAS